MFRAVTEGWKFIILKIDFEHMNDLRPFRTTGHEGYRPRDAQGRLYSYWDPARPPTPEGLEVPQCCMLALLDSLICSQHLDIRSLHVIQKLDCSQRYYIRV